jgi:hypothetical protein
MPAQIHLSYTKPTYIVYTYHPNSFTLMSDKGFHLDVDVMATKHNRRKKVRTLTVNTARKRCVALAGSVGSKGWPFILWMGRLIRSPLEVRAVGSAPLGSVGSIPRESANSRGCWAKNNIPVPRAVSGRREGLHAKRLWSSLELRMASWRRANAFSPSPYRRGMFTSNMPLQPKQHVSRLFLNCQGTGLN